jgi:hypothetical protein
MKLYADLPLRRAAQLAGDVLVIVWVVVWVKVGQAVHDATARLEGAGRQMQSAGNGIGRNMRSASASVSDVPLVGDKLRQPFDQVGRAATSLARAGVDQQRDVAHLATVLGLVVALLPVVLAVGVWLPRRIRFARLAAAAQRFIDADADLDLFALRAMSRQPMHLLARVSPDPAGAWRRGDAAVVRALAVLELRSAGLRPPA